MKVRHWMLLIYIVIGVFFGIYGWLFGSQGYKGFAYNLGMGIVWPAIIFPGLGKLIGGLIVVALVVAVSVGNLKR